MSVNRQLLFYLVFPLMINILGIGGRARLALAGRNDTSVELVKHSWQADEVWEKIGRTQYLWNVTIRNNSDVRKRVYAYYYLLDEKNVPLARNVANRFVAPHQTAEIVASSYIMTVDLPKVVKSRVKIKVGFPN